MRYGDRRCIRFGLPDRPRSFRPSKPSSKIALQPSAGRPGDRWKAPSRCSRFASPDATASRSLRARPSNAPGSFPDRGCEVRFGSLVPLPSRPALTQSVTHHLARRLAAADSDEHLQGSRLDRLARSVRKPASRPVQLDASLCSAPKSVPWRWSEHPCALLGSRSRYASRLRVFWAAWR